MFKTIAAMQRTKTIATVEVYEKNSEHREHYFFLTKDGVLREPTKNGNRKITDAKAKALTGKNGLGWLHELHKEQAGNKYLDRTFGNYEIDLCTDLDVYCEEDADDFEEYKVTVEDVERAYDLRHND